MNTFQMFSTNVACCKLRLSLVYQLETQCLAFTKIYIYKLKVLIIGDLLWLIMPGQRAACWLGMLLPQPGCNNKWGIWLFLFFPLYRVVLTVKLSITFNLDANFGAYNLFKMLTCNYIVLLFYTIVYRFLLLAPVLLLLLAFFVDCLPFA